MPVLAVESLLVHEGAGHGARREEPHLFKLLCRGLVFLGVAPDIRDVFVDWLGLRIRL